MYLTTQQITDAIMEYILDDRNQQAVMIDGEWGSGKTYFVEHILYKKLKTKIEEEKSKRHLIYISLYGISDSGEIRDQLLMKHYASSIAKRLKTKSELIEHIAGMGGKAFSVLGSYYLW